MQRHRFLASLEDGPFVPATSAAPPASAFMVCPGACLLPGWAWSVYQMAFEQAQAVVRPSRLERLETATLN